MTSADSNSLPSSHGDCPSDLMLDRMLLGELSPSSIEYERTRRHVGECSECSRRVAELERFSAAFPQEAPPLATPRPAPRRRWAVATGSAVAALAASVIAVVAVMDAPTGSERLKGGDALTVYVKRTRGAVEILESGTSVAAGDAVRFELRTSAPSWAVVLGVDSSQAVTVYAPSSGQALLLEPGKTTVPEGSIVLDDTPGLEVFVALACEAPLTVEDAVRDTRAALVAAGGDPLRLGALRSGCRQHSVTARKSQK